MIYLYGYLGIGVATLIAVLVAHFVAERKEVDALIEKFAGVPEERRTAWYRIANDFVVPLLSCVFVVAAWPVAFFMKGQDIARNYASSTKSRGFTVLRAHLQERLSVQEIERRETVKDPLHSAPEVPFGHLHGAWKKLLEGRPEGGELWSFSGRWKTNTGREEIRSGYVTVFHGKPELHLLTVLKPIADGEARERGVPWRWLRR